MERLFQSSPTYRRSFIDRLIFSSRNDYNKVINKYKKLLSERIKILQSHNIDNQWLNQVDKEISKINLNFHVGFPRPAKIQQKLEKIKQKVLNEVAGCAVSSDQFSRISDLAIDFCEDVPELSIEAVKKIKEIFVNSGATAKISSVHVNA